MKRSVLSVLLVACLLSACAILKPKSTTPSQFVTPLSNTLLNVEIPARGAVATLVLVARNQGVDTWQTGDNVSVSLRSGVFVATRGLGFDVMGSDVQQTLSALAGRQSGQYTVTRRYLSADNHSEFVTATCTMNRSGSDRQYFEQCNIPGGVFRNEYLLDGSGQIVQSKQWVGPEVQYLKTSYVIAQ